MSETFQTSLELYFKTHNYHISL